MVFEKVFGIFWQFMKLKAEEIKYVHHVINFQIDLLFTLF